MSKIETPPTTLGYEFAQGSVKTAAAAAGASSADLWMVPPSQLFVLPNFNIRLTDNADYIKGVQELADSMIANGFFKDKPFSAIVRRSDAGDQFQIFDGHRRYAALQIAMQTAPEKFEKVPVVARPPATSMADVTIGMLHAAKELNPFERSIGVKRLVHEYNLEPAEVARRLGITQHYVDDLLLLQAAPESVKNMVIKGKVSPSLVIREMRADAKGIAGRLKEAQATADAAGKDKVTAKHVGERKPRTPVETSPKVPVQDDGSADYAFHFKAKRGDVVDLAAIAPIRLIGDGAWYALSFDEPDKARIVQDVSIQVKVKFGEIPHLEQHADTAPEVDEATADL